MADLKQSTNYTRMFMMIANTDHISGLNTGATAAVVLSKNGATGVTATNSPATAVDTTNFPGLYKILFNNADTSILGQLGVHCTATGADPTDFIDDVRSQLFTDLQLAASGRVLVASQVIQNTAFLLPFIMTVNGVPTPSLTGFAASRNLAGAGFSPCANSVVEDGVGWYHLLLTAADTNATVIEYHITANAADDRNITLYTQP